MNILLIGSGGREHALAWAMAQSSHCDVLYCAPGNAGIAMYAKCVDIGAEDIPALVTFAQDKEINFVVIGPEAPMVAGLTDALKEVGIEVFGPSQAAAQLEGSKAFMKDLCAKYNIPTAKYGRFTDLGDAIVHIKTMSTPVVVKTSGLAAGKGVIIAQTHEAAIEAAEGMLSGDSFGEAGAEIVIEEFLDGEELSYFALSDGKTVLPLTSAQDHKRAYDGDEGPNTGGMGAYSPAHLMTPELEQKIIKTIVEPTIQGMAQEGCPFTGVLFAGIMVVDGAPILLEHNVRFGDPECQVIVPRLKTDLVSLLHAASCGELDNIEPEWHEDTALCVVMASKGYPGAYTKGTVIEGLSEANKSDGVTVFHAGTKQDENGKILSNGGRVLGIVAKAGTVQEAQKQAYDAIEKISWPEGFYRRDIGWRAVKALDDAA